MPVTRAPRRRRTTRPQHGTEAEYRRGCGCELCRAAATAAREARKARKDREAELEATKRELEHLQLTAPVPGKVADVPRETYVAYVVARQAADELELSLLRAELAFKRAIADAEIIRVGRRRVGTWATFRRTFFDSQAFRAKHPALWDRFQRQGETRRFVISMFAATPPARRARAGAKGQRR